VSEYDEARQAFRRKWGFDPSPAIAKAISAGEFGLEGGTEEERAFTRAALLTTTGDGRFTLYPAGDCVHCGLPINESRLFEFTYGGGQRPVTVLVHTGSGHERCEGRETLAERSE
jgi:hypothetical protein